MRAWPVFLLVTVLPCTVSARQPEPASVQGAVSPSDAAKIAEVIAFEKAMEAAVVRGDVEFLDRALSADFLFTHGDGWTAGGAPLRVDTKKTWLEYVAQQPPPYVYRELDSVQVELHGDIAITYGRYRYQPRQNSSSINSGHLYVWFERVYAKRNGQWQHLSHRTVRGPVREQDSPESAR